jgi:hypothetical protein
MKANGKQIQKLKQPSKASNYEMVDLPPPIPMVVGTTTTYFHKKAQGTFEALQYHKNMGNFWVENGDLYKFSTFRRGYVGHDLLSKCKHFCEIKHQEVGVITTFQS